MINPAWAMPSPFKVGSRRIRVLAMCAKMIAGIVPTNATTEHNSEAIARAEYLPVASAGPAALAEDVTGSGGRTGRGAGCVIGFGAGVHAAAAGAGAGAGASAAAATPAPAATAEGTVNVF